MLGWLLLIGGALGLGAAGWLDLKTTEFPDWLPYALIAYALAVRGSFAWLLGDWSILTNSIVIGLVFLGAGLGLYYLRQWGDGDAWLLGALGFLFPDSAGFAFRGSLPVATVFQFPVALLFNFFLIAFAYLIAYALGLGLRTPHTLSLFKRTLKRGELRRMLGIALGFAAALAIVFGGLGIVEQAPFTVLAAVVGFPLLVLGLLLFLRYGRFIERTVFKRRVPASKLRPGDVPAGARWRVLTAAEVARLRKQGGYVWIKEGVRFAPVFVLALLATIFAGGMLWFV